MALKLPEDPVRRIECIIAHREELAMALRTALFDARMQGRFEEALSASRLSRKRALAETRHENESRGRMVRWSS